MNPTIIPRKIAAVNTGDFVTAKERTNGVCKNGADCTVIPISFRFVKPLEDRPYGAAQQMAAGEIGRTDKIVRSLREEKESHEEKADNNFGRGVNPFRLPPGFLGC